MDILALLSDKGHPLKIQGDPWGFPFLLTAPVYNATESRVLPCVLFVLPDSSSLGGAVEARIFRHRQTQARDWLLGLRPFQPFLC